jgi:hypothetical protein
MLATSVVFEKLPKEINHPMGTLVRFLKQNYVPELAKAVLS